MSRIDLAPEDILEFTWDKYERKRRKIDRPTVISWELTRACDLNCIHCAVQAGQKTQTELSTQDGLIIIEDIAASGTKHLLLAGGEPLVREDIFIIAEFAAQRLSVGITTNGFSLTPSKARKLKDIGVNQIRISVDGAKKETHDHIRGKGSFQKAVEAIKTCVDLKFKDVGIETTLFAYNYHELDDIVDLASDLRVHILEVGDMAPMGKARRLSHLCLTPEQRKAMLERLAKRQQSLGEMMITSELPHFFIVNKEMQNQCIDPYHHHYALGCGAGIIGAGLTCDGKLVPCPLGLNIFVGDLTKERLTDVWNRSPVLQRLRSREVTGKCGRCEYRYACGGCRGAAAAAGDMMGEDPGCWYAPALTH